MGAFDSKGICGHVSSGEASTDTTKPETAITDPRSGLVPRNTELRTYAIISATDGKLGKRKDTTTTNT